MTRALLLSDVYFPRVNGVSTSIRSFREDLEAEGVHTTLVVPEYGVVATESSEAGIVRVPAASVPRDPEDRRMRMGALRAALARLDGAPFDLVHVQTPFLAHYAGVRYARRRGLPVVATYHTLFAEYLHHYVPLLPRRLGGALARAVTRAQCRELDAIVAPSEPMRRLLADYGVHRPVQVIPTGLTAGRFESGDGARFRLAWRLPAGRPLLLYVGRVAHEKNIEFLVHAFCQLRSARPDALLVIAGEGPARPRLDALVRQLGIGRDVAFIGYLEREQALRDCYAAADVFVFASRTETQGLVLLEAMAQGRPVVSTAHLGTTSILLPGCGAAIVPDDHTAFARAVLEFLGDPARAARAGAVGRRFAEAWSSRVMARRLARFYRELLRRDMLGARVQSSDGAGGVSTSP